MLPLMFVITVSGMESLLLDWKRIIQILKDKKFESAENVRRASQQTGHSVQGTEVSVFFVSMKSDGMGHFRVDIFTW